MNKTAVLSLTLLLSFAWGNVSEGRVETSSPLPQSLSQSLQQGKFKDLEQTLRNAIQKAVAGKSIDEILADENTMYLVTAAELIRITGADHMDTLFAKNRKYARFLISFLQNSEWMQLYLRAGLVPTDTETGLRVLADIWNMDGKSPDFGQYRSLATGIASAWGAGRNALRLQDAEKNFRKGRKCDPLWRYNFFKQSHKSNKLHPNFINLQPWEIRFIAGNAVDDASFQYMQDNVNVPPDQYGGACWFAEYRGTSEFGESIQGPLFYVPWSQDMGSSQKTVEHGGVCGSLSTLGHIGAAARGIPAYTVGQPGHCAYGFRLERGKWQGGFGGPDGGMKDYIFDGPAPTSTNLMEAVFASDDNVEQSYLQASLARTLTSLGDDTLAREAWEKTMKTAPLNAFFRKDFQQFALNRRLFSPDQWMDYSKRLLTDFKGHGFAAMDILRDVQPETLEGRNEEAKMQWFAYVNDTLAKTPVSWAVDIIPVLKDEVNLLQGPDAGRKILELALQTHLNMGDGTNFGYILNWGIKEFVEKGKADVFTEAFGIAAANPPQTMNPGKDAVKDPLKLDAKKLQDAYKKAILASEKARSLPAFNALSKASSAFQKPEKGPDPGKLECPSGTLASEGGLLMPSSSAWDRPWDHASVLTKKGGFFRTNDEEKPNVIVELPSTVRMSGLLLVKSHGNQERIKHIKISRSTDGATWFDVASTEDMPLQWKIETPDTPETRWIKVESTNPEKNSLFMRNILVFKKNA